MASELRSNLPNVDSRANFRSPLLYVNLKLLGALRSGIKEEHLEARGTAAQQCAEQFRIATKAGQVTSATAKAISQTGW